MKFYSNLKSVANNITLKEAQTAVAVILDSYIEDEAEDEDGVCGQRRW